MTEPTESVDTTVTLEVPLRALRQAIASVLPHAEPTKTGDDPGDLSRLRLVARKGELLVVATNSTTSALASVPIVEDSRLTHFRKGDGVFELDVPLGPWRPFLQGMKVGKPTASADEGLAELVLDIAAVTITDRSALLPGYAQTVPTLPRAEAFPAVVDILHKAMAEAAGDSKPLVTAHGALALFLPAAKAYKVPLSLEPTGSARSRGFLVLCGSKFIGTISSRHEDDNSLATRDRDRHEHLTRLGLAPAGDPIPELAGV